MQKMRRHAPSRYFLLLLALMSGSACAAGALPYEGWLSTLQQSFTGPVAFSISLIGIISCGATLIFMGSEIGHFVRSIIYIVMVMTLLVGSNSLMTQLFKGSATAYNAPAPDPVLRDTPPTPWNPDAPSVLYRHVGDNGTVTTAPAPTLAA